MGQPLAACCNPTTNLAPQIEPECLPKEVLTPQKPKADLENIIRSIHEPLTQTLRNARKYRHSPPTTTTNQQNQKLWQIQFQNEKKQSQYVVCRGGTQGRQVHGEVSLYFPNGEIFQGCVKNRSPIQGIYVFKKGCFYVGQMSQFNAQGKGRYQNHDAGYTYEGTWSKSLPHGKGKETFKNGDSYEGEVMYGQKFGQGIYRFADGKVYVGSFYYNQSDGKGKMVYANGSYYQGTWKFGKFDGSGKFVFANGQTYEGAYVQGMRHGRGKYTFKNHSWFEGEWKNGLQSGQGSFHEGYDTVNGEWRDGDFVG